MKYNLQKSHYFLNFGNPRNDKEVFNLLGAVCHPWGHIIP